MPRRSAAARAAPSLREAMAVTRQPAAACMAGITVSVPIRAVLRMPHRSGVIRSAYSRGGGDDADSLEELVEGRVGVEALVGDPLGERAQPVPAGRQVERVLQAIGGGGAQPPADAL